MDALLAGHASRVHHVRNRGGSFKLIEPHLKRC
jgi:hypothetical protein